VDTLTSIEPENKYQRLRHQTLVKPDWLPPGLWSELDELREEHHQLIEERKRTQAEAVAVRQRFEEEDRQRQEAYRRGKQAKVTPRHEREDAIEDAKAKAGAAMDNLEEFLDEAVQTIQRKQGDWLEDLRRAELLADEKREEAMRLLAEADQLLAETKRNRLWVTRTAEDGTMGHISYREMGVAPSRQAADFKTVLRTAGGDAPYEDMDFNELGDDELQVFVEKATVQEVVDKAAPGSGLAKRLLAAEEAATGGDPRKGVVEGLAS
jgi:hypothetical protein